MKKITERMLAGGGVTQDPATLKNVADNIAGAPSALSAKPAPGRRKVS